MKAFKSILLVGFVVLVPGSFLMLIGYYFWKKKFGKKVENDKL